MIRKSSTLKKECFVHEKISDDWIKNNIRQSVCQNLPITHEHDGKFYCILHFPSPVKTELFTKELEKRIDNKQYDFSAVYFPDIVNFANQVFEKTVNFSNATFHKKVDFGDVKFNSLTFFSFAHFNDAVYFHNSIFNQSSDFVGAFFNNFVDFREVNFNESVSFLSATFALDSYFQAAVFNKELCFSYAVFQETSQTYFDEAKFKGRVEFNNAILKGYIAFVGKLDNLLFNDEKTLLDLQNVRISDAKNILFHTVRLEPSWFINSDAREFTFTECYWYSNSKHLNAKIELQNLVKRDFETPNPLLTKTCQQLADNYEENKGFELASLFRQIANESKRLDYFWWYQPLTLHWWYWLSSFYGESWKWALAVLIGIWFGFAVIYKQFDFNVCQQPQTCEARKLFIGESMKQSFGAMFLQKSEFRKPMETAETFTLFENILAPLQAALLALAIRRKFMR